MFPIPRSFLAVLLMLFAMPAGAADCKMLRDLDAQQDGLMGQHGFSGPLGNPSGALAVVVLLLMGEKGGTHLQLIVLVSPRPVKRQSDGV